MAENVTFIGNHRIDPQKGAELVKATALDPSLITGIVEGIAEAAEIIKAIEEFQRFFGSSGTGVRGTDTVIMYRHDGGNGAARGFNTGDAISRFRDIHYRVNAIQWKHWNDEVSSIKVEGGIALMAYENDNYGGNRLLVVGPSSIPSLKAIGWNDTISSCKVIPADRDVILDQFP